MATEIWTFQDQKLADLDLSGFEVETRDGVIGRVDRTTRDASGSYLIVDAGAAMPLGRRVVLPAGVVDTVDLDDRRLAVSAGRSEILSSPEYDPARPFDEGVRSRIGSYYASAAPTRTEAARGSRQRAKPAPQRAKATQQRPKPREQRAKATASRSNDEPTKEELYTQAKRLNIEGRSKMNKAQLKRAVERRK
jgi:hypothetical protein